ncbi:MAG: hypothetical protein IPM79_09880 [Polyangiaceae bacterium]|nr:hypothetical protein [Polyangiaceae bacterium]
MSVHARACGAVLAGALAMAPPRGAAAAEPPDLVQAAERAYDEGVKAQTSGDYARAARLFAEADALAPNPVALEAALSASILADDAVLGMELALRAERDPSPGASLADAKARTLTKLSSRAGYVEVRCNGCEAKLDGRAIVLGRAHAAATGPHAVEATFNGLAALPISVVVAGGQRVVVDVPAPAPKPPPPARLPEPTERSGVHPALFFTGLGLTVAFGAGTIASAVDLYAISDEFEASPSPALAEAGESAELRTYALEGVTALVGLTTIAIGVFATDWDALSPGKKGGAKVGVGLGYVGVTIAL